MMAEALEDVFDQLVGKDDGETIATIVHMVFV